MSILNTRIQKMRKRRNKTLKEVAEAIGVQEATLQRYESGVIKNIPHEKISAIAKFLKCSPAYLMGWQDDFNDTEPIHAELIDLINSLTTEQAREALNYIDYLKNKDKS